MVQTVEVPAGRRLTDQISLGVLACTLDRDAVDEAVAVSGRGAKRSDGKLPPHVMVYFTVAMALFADDDYEEIATRLTETLAVWGCWDTEWSVPTSGGITQARQRLGYEPLKQLFGTVARPAADELTRGAFPGGPLVMMPLTCDDVCLWSPVWRGWQSWEPVGSPRRPVLVRPRRGFQRGCSQQ